MAKAGLPDLRKAEMDEIWRAQVGKAVERMRRAAGLTLQEFAAAVQRDERQVARWESGKEHAQIAAIVAVEALRAFLVIALAEMVQDRVEVITEIRVKRA